MERVSIIEGNNPVIIVAPHGGDDDFTGEIAERMAAKCDGYAVINWGWKRADKVDYYKSRANCNNVEHCHEDVVKDEFLNPIIKFVNRLGRDFFEIDVISIHGVANEVRKKAKDPALDVIVGWGAGNPPSVTADEIRRDAFMYHLDVAGGMGVYQGKAGGNYSGRSKSNLNQLFRQWYPDENVHSLQLELVKDLRDDRLMAQVTGDELGLVYNKYNKFLEDQLWKLDGEFGKFRKSIPGV
jgi:hypothetical protein